VTLNFRLSLADGTVVEASAAGEPLTLTLGEGALAAGLEHCLLGLRAGERRRFELGPLPDFGDAGEPRLQTLARADFPSGLALEPGAVVAFRTPSGEEVAGRIEAVGPDEVTVDFAHPLAGHPLIFEVEIISVEPPKTRP
jgi:FKBP-type peptidyl-prolyl cis-trans isomerase SlpA